MGESNSQPPAGFDAKAYLQSLLEGAGAWRVPSGPYAGWTWNDLLSALKAGQIQEQDVRQIVAASPPTAGGVQLGDQAIEADIKSNTPGATSTPDQFGNTASGKITSSVADVLGTVPTLGGAQNAVASAYANAPGLIAGAGILPTSLADGDIAQRVAQGQSTAGQAYNTLIAKGYPPDKALAYLQTNANVPMNWVPNVTSQGTQPQNGQTTTANPAALTNATLNNPFLPKSTAPMPTTGPADQVVGGAQSNGGLLPGAQSYTGQHADFYNTWAPAAAYAQQKYGLDPSIVLAINASESGWGNAPGNMGFGIKGPGANLATHEVVNGQNQNITDSFRQYGSPQQAVDDFMNFLQTNSRYAGALANFNKTGDTAQLIQDINKAGYATDPNWASSILSLAKTTGAAIGSGAGAGGTASATTTGSDGQTYYDANAASKAAA